jgi:hypothetical protein
MKNVKKAKILDKKLNYLKTKALGRKSNKSISSARIVVGEKKISEVGRGAAGGKNMVVRPISGKYIVVVIH